MNYRLTKYKNGYIIVDKTTNKILHRGRKLAMLDKIEQLRLQDKAKEKHNKEMEYWKSIL